MTDLHVDNTLYLLHAVACAYLRAHHLTRREFGVADRLIVRFERIDWRGL